MGEEREKERGGGGRGEVEGEDRWRVRGDGGRGEEEEQKTGGFRN